jgi:hypothetical protein
MARFSKDSDRLNYTVVQEGKEYQQRLTKRSQVLFSNLMNLLPSTYISTVCGPNYSIELKAVATELARVEMSLEDVYFDTDFFSTRSEFLYSIVGYLVFLDGKLPTTSFDDEGFREFLLNVIEIYFQGSVPKSLQEAVQLLIPSGVSITENYLLARIANSGYDISDQFGFQVTVDSTSSGFPTDVFSLNKDIKLLLDILRPAHTLFSVRYLFRDPYDPNSGAGVLDSTRFRMANYWYEDFRVFPKGLKGRDRLGVKVNIKVTAEDHSEDF